MGTVITLDSAITSVPSNTPSISVVGDAITSDAFNRAGALSASVTDLYAGGASKTWSGTPQAANVTNTTGGGQLVLGAQAVFSQCVDAGRPNAQMSLKLIVGSLAAAGQNSMIEFRKALADTGDVYRLTISGYNSATLSSTLTLYKRISGTASLIAAGPTIKNGQVLKIDINGTRIRVYLDDIIQMDVTDTSITAGNFFGFAGSSGGRSYTVSNFVLRAN